MYEVIVGSTICNRTGPTARWCCGVLKFRRARPTFHNVYLQVLTQHQCSTNPKDVMDDSMHHSGWDASDNTKPIDAQAFNSDFDFWDPMCLFSEPQPSTNASIDSIVAAPQDFQNIATSNQEFSHYLDNETTSPDHLIPKSYALPIDDKKRDIQKEAREFQDM